MRKALAAIFAVVALTLAGCGGNIQTGSGEQSINSDETYRLKDGRSVTCIVGPGRLSCDWSNAK
ncbi:hypothetical protein [Paenarthrobacter nitroguajacolicus]|uniref:hypothetical protein n=1 Tax=Paenarthrobacter nitroguajacolicus TaxID=211146 RepID=UPI0015C1C0A5|nr:hypothetical protein [Paenarthrobacter nitroguajacolicus]NWL32958.1 hypothetical protein [Paenarthrobacter nitroguajacolicus]